MQVSIFKHLMDACYLMKYSLDGHDVKYTNISYPLADTLDGSVLVTLSWVVTRKMTHVLSVDRLAIGITTQIQKCKCNVCLPASSTDCFYLQLEQKTLSLQTRNKINYWEAKKSATNMVKPIIHMHLWWQETTCNQDINSNHLNNNHHNKSSYPLNSNNHLNITATILATTSNLIYINNYLSPSTA